MHATRSKVFTILLVEDNAGDVEMFLRAVEEELPRSDDEEVELVFAARAEGGLKILEERTIDLVIIDVRLPGMSGIEMLQRIQSMNRRLPVIMISWVNAVDTAVDAVKHGAFDYVVKPFDKLDLAIRIHRAMRMSDFLLEGRKPVSTIPASPVKDLIGQSPGIQEVLTMIEAMAGVSSRP